MVGHHAFPARAVPQPLGAGVYRVLAAPIAAADRQPRHAQAVLLRKCALHFAGELLHARGVDAARSVAAAVVVCVEFAAAQAQGFAFLAQLLDALGCGLGRHDLHL